MRNTIYEYILNTLMKLFEHFHKLSSDEIEHNGWRLSSKDDNDRVWSKSEQKFYILTNKVKMNRSIRLLSFTRCTNQILLTRSKTYILYLIETTEIRFFNV